MISTVGVYRVDVRAGKNEGVKGNGRQELREGNSDHPPPPPRAAEKDNREGKARKCVVFREKWILAVIETRTTTRGRPQNGFL